MKLTWELIASPGSQRILVLSPSLAGHVEHQWGDVARLLAADAHVVLVYLPGHGPVEPWEDDEATLDVVAQAIAEVAAEARTQIGGRLPVYYAGLSVSGAIGLHLARDHADLFSGIVVVGSAATVGEPRAWLDKAELVDQEGTAPQAAATGQRWFTPAFAAARPDVVATLLQDIVDTDDHAYAQFCRALAAHDVRADLGAMRVPLLLIAGEQDASTPLENVRLVAERAPDATTVVVPDVAHQVPVCAPGIVADRIREFLAR